MVDQADLVPYISAAFARGRAAGLGSLLSDLVDEAAAIIPAIDAGPTRAIVEQIEPAATSVSGGTLHSAGLIYSETRAPRWAPETALQDVTHQLVLLCRRARGIAIVTTDATVGRRCRKP